MPAKKKTTAKKATKKTGNSSPPAAPTGKNCDLEHICAYLKELSNYLAQDFTKDYKKLRIAVCNLDHKVFGSGVPDLNKRFCTGGQAGEPADPPPTPIWG